MYDANGNLLARSGSGAYATAWLLTDRQGSISQVLNLNGAVEDSITYDVYGNIMSQTSSNWTGNFTFQGMRLDATTGFLMANYRFFAAGRAVVERGSAGVLGGGCEYAEGGWQRRGK